MNPSIPRIGLAKSAGNPVNPDVSKKKKKTWFFRMASRQDIRFNIFNQSIEFVQDAAKAFPVVEICSSINAFAIGFAVQALNLSEFYRHSSCKVVVKKMVLCPKKMARVPLPHCTKKCPFVPVSMLEHCCLSKTVVKRYGAAIRIGRSRGLQVVLLVSVQGQKMLRVENLPWQIMARSAVLAASLIIKTLV